jgi:hypothetical protein
MKPAGRFGEVIEKADDEGELNQELEKETGSSLDCPS